MNRFHLGEFELLADLNVLGLKFGDKEFDLVEILVVEVGHVG